MSQVQPVRTNEVRAAIARAAAATGVDFGYLLAQARIESSLDPSARAATSSAAGLYQFTSGTWLSMLGRHGGEHGLAMPASRAEALALRFDPQASALMAARLARENAEALQRVLGRAPDAAELYLAHFLGVGGASTFVSALAGNPGQSAAALLPQAAAANRTIFHDRTGAPRSVGEVMELLRGKVERAVQSESWSTRSATFAAAGPSLGPIQSEFQAKQATAPVSRVSMADTLQAAFGVPAAAAPGHVRSAYARFRSLGL